MESEEKDGTLVEFIPDAQLFGEYRFDEDYLDNRLWRYVYLNAGPKIYYNKKLFHSSNGLYDLLANERPQREVKQ